MANKKNVKIKLQLDDGAKMPVRAHETDTGYDLHIKSFELVEGYDDEPKLEWITTEDGTCLVKKFLFGLIEIPLLRNIFQRKVVRHIIIDTGVHVQPENGYWTMATPNSRVAKRPFWLGNSVGIIDQDYTGSIKYIYKVLPWITDKDIQEYFKVGNVCGQLIIMKRYDADFEETTLDSTARGDGGFGSSEKK